MPQPPPLRPGDPDFPHGTDRGVSYKCTCDRCKAHRRVMDGQRILRRLRNEPAPGDYVPVDGVADHVRSLLDLPYVTPRAVAHAVGVTPRTVYDLLRGDRAQMRRCTRDALLGATVEQARAAAGWADPRVPKTQANALLALGYPYSWQSARSGVKRTYFQFDRNRRRLAYATTAMAMAKLAADVGDKPAGPEDGIPAHTARQARASAAKRGYVTPDHYDEDWRRVPDASEDPDAEPRLMLEALRLSLRGHSTDDVCALLGCARKDVKDARAAVGLRFVYSRDAHLSEPVPGQRERVALVREHLAVYDCGGHEADTWAALLADVAARAVA